VAGRGGPAGRVAAIATVRQITRLLAHLGEPRTTGRGVADCTVGFAGPDVEAIVEGSGILAAVDASIVLTVSVTSSVDVGVPVDVTCLVWVGASVEVTGGETSAFPVF
jgi:hypothetical protein